MGGLLREAGVEQCLQVRRRGALDLQRGETKRESEQILTDKTIDPPPSIRDVLRWISILGKGSPENGLTQDACLWGMMSLRLVIC